MGDLKGIKEGLLKPFFDKVRYLGGCLNRENRENFFDSVMAIINYAIGDRMHARVVEIDYNYIYSIFSREQEYNEIKDALETARSIGDEIGKYLMKSKRLSDLLEINAYCEDRLGRSGEDYRKIQQSIIETKDFILIKETKDKEDSN
ncbi:MAG: hypothetical protein QXQ40_01645 [Candidatus Aenigmatarchaeota archaeon]